VGRSVEGEGSSIGLLGSGRCLADLEDSAERQFLLFSDLSIGPVCRKAQSLNSIALLKGYTFPLFTFHYSVYLGE